MATASVNMDRSIPEGSPAAPPSKSKRSLPVSAIVGGGVGAVLLLVVALLIIFRNKLCGCGRSHSSGQALMIGRPMPYVNPVARPHAIASKSGTYPVVQAAYAAPSTQHAAYDLSPAPYATSPALSRPSPVPSSSSTMNASPLGAKVPTDPTSSFPHTATVSVRSTTAASPALPAFTSTAARNEGRFSSTALEVTLDAMCDNGHAFLGVYEVLGPMQRAAGGQGLVQFMRRVHGSEEFAVKFYTYLPAFDRERALYVYGALKAMMPATHEIVANGDGGVSYGTYTFPPCIVLERGESLETWALREDRDFVTTLQVLHHIAQRLLSMHKAGWAHLDLKPGNVLRRPTKHSWTLIDFGCSAQIGSMCEPSYSLQYVAPEVFAAVNAGEQCITVSAAADIWALGVIAFELLSRSQTFPTGTSKEAITSQILGQQPLPWEEGGSGKAALEQLRGLRRSVLRCLCRNPESRVSAAQLVETWEHMFDSSLTANR